MNMLGTQQWIYTLSFVLLLLRPAFNVAISYPVNSKIYTFEGDKACSTAEKRAFGSDAVTLTIIVITILNIIVYKLRDLQEAKYGEKDKTVLLSSGRICRCFSLAEIQLATHNFDNKCLIGKGGSAKVYKGVIDNGSTNVAIKRLSLFRKKAAGSAFWTEIEMLSKFRHSHLVSLIGYCDESDEMILVFDYIPNGTLADNLHQERSNTLSWAQRLRICIGAARGLDYLHTGASIYQRVIHRDVKSTNILLDDNLEAKIADFGISKIVAANKGCTYVSTIVRGTFGYIDPAYYSTGRLTKKSDVYALGVVLFEILCGRKAVDSSRDDQQISLAGWAQQIIREGRVDEIVDSNLKMQISKNSLMAFVKIAYQCLNSQPMCRPTMADIVVVLEFSLALQDSPNSAQVYGPFGNDNSHSSKAVEIVYGMDQLKLFQMTRTTITLSRKVRKFISAPFRVLSVYSNTKPSKRISDGVKKIHITRVENNRMMLNKISIPPEAKGCIVPANSRMFTLPELTATTRGFNPDMMLGKGPYGNVFIGWVDEETFSPSRIGIGMAIIIKRFNPGGYGEFRQQMEVDLCDKFYHPNLVKLLGFCSDGQEACLVYEYTAKGSLTRYLYRDNGNPLSWDVWLKILTGAARYLVFLHSSENPIILCDFRPSAILLDGDFNAKIADCGRARYGPADGDTLVTTIRYASSEQCSEVEGYLSPEYKETGRLSTKNDVYAFGVLLLEILTGMRVIDVNQRNKKNLIDKARPVLACKRKVKQVLNPNLLEHRCCPQGVDVLLSAIPELTLKCLDLNPDRRPSMIQVLETLEEIKVQQFDC